MSRRGNRRPSTAPPILNSREIIYEWLQMESSIYAFTITKDQIRIITPITDSRNQNHTPELDLINSLHQLSLSNKKTRRKYRRRKPKTKPVEKPDTPQRSASFQQLTKSFRIISGVNNPSGTSYNVRKAQNQSTTLNNVQVDCPPRPHTVQEPNRQTQTKTNKILKKKTHFIPFPKYWSNEQVQNGLIEGSLVQGILRINPKNSKEAYVNHEDRTIHDYLIPSVIDRNRAFEGDVVVLKIKAENKWKKDQVTARVVYILKKVHPRVAVGLLKPPKDPSKRTCTLVPRDQRIPRLQIPALSWPANFKQNADLYQNTLFKAKVLDWINVYCAIGIIIDAIGNVGDLEGETKALLAENSLNITPLPTQFLKEMPVIIPHEEINKREDLRSECIFTIDPATARDLDDALSCRVLRNGNYEIGVHISDVGYYLKENTALDREVAKRATSIYLVDKVHHMLPEELCMRCSLIPGQDKLAFSVIFQMNNEAKVISRRFSRTIINSCVQLSYEHAQEMIDCTNTRYSNLPLIHNNFNAKQIEQTIKILHKLALILRARRFLNGSLKIDQPKIGFQLAANTGLPISYDVYENKPSHRMIEEFMLLANETVARRIKQQFPDVAFLRCHDPPKEYLLSNLQSMLRKYDIQLDITDAKSLQASILQYANEDDPIATVRMAALNHLLTKPMMRAKYFCTGNCESEEEYYHYALAMDFYTHFTSPIRRYADVMVHRLLAADLEGKACTWSIDYVSRVAEICNKQKYNAKRASEASTDLYLAHFIELNSPFERNGVVVSVKDHFFDVLIIQTGSVVRLYPSKLGNNIQAQIRDEKVFIKYEETDAFPEFNSILELFSVVIVQLTRCEKSSKLDGKLVRPITSQIYSSIA